MHLIVLPFSLVDAAFGEVESAVAVFHASFELALVPSVGLWVVVEELHSRCACAFIVFADFLYRGEVASLVGAKWSLLVEILLVFAGVFGRRKAGLADWGQDWNVLCLFGMNDVAVMDFTDKVDRDFGLVLKLLFLETRVFERRTDIVVLLLQFFQNWGYVANGFEYWRVSLKSRKMAIAELLGNFSGAHLIAGFFLDEVNDVLPDLRIAVGQRGNLGPEIMIRDSVGQFIESLSVDMTDRAIFVISHVYLFDV